MKSTRRYERTSWRTVRCAVVAAALAGLPASLPGAGGAAAAEPKTATESELNATFDELLALMRVEEPSPADWAQASWLAVQLSRYGEAGVPAMRRRFSRSTAADEALPAGIFVAVYGQAADRLFVRKDLETNRVKRKWLADMLGSRDAINASLREGAHWRSATKLIPSLDGCRRLCRLCLQSADALVRRAGLYWGYWINDDAYWQAVRNCADSDADRLTRVLAQHFLDQRRKQTGR